MRTSARGLWAALFALALVVPACVSSRTVDADAATGSSERARSETLPGVGDPAPLRIEADGTVPRTRQVDGFVGTLLGAEASSALQPPARP